MEIIFDQIHFQLAVVLFIITFLLVARKKIIFCTALIPLLAPLYLIKIYIYPLVWLKSLKIALESGFLVGTVTALNSLFALPERNSAVLRSDFGQINQIFLPTNLLEILLLILIFLGRKVVLKQLKIFYLKKSENPIIIALSGFFLASFFSLLWAENRATTLGVTKGWIFIPILIFLLVSGVVRSKKFQKIFLGSLKGAGIFYLLSSLIFLFSKNLTYDHRLAGIFLSPNHLAMVLVPTVLIFGLEFFCRGKNKMNASLLLLLSSLSLLALYFTYSYTSWMALGTTAALAATVFLLKADGSARKRIFKAALPLLLIPTTVALYFQLDNPKLTSILNGEYYSSLNSRTMIWQSALLITKDHWLFGIGGGNFQSVYLEYQKYFKEPYEEWAVPEPHNIFLAFHLSLGITGLLSFLLLLLYVFRLIIQYLRTARLNEFSKEIGAARMLWLWSALYLTAFLVTGITDTPYWKNDLSLLFWLSITIIQGLTRRKIYVTLEKLGDNSH